MNSSITVLVYDESTEKWLDTSKISETVTIRYCSNPITVFDLVSTKQIDILIISDKIQLLSCVEFLDKLQSFDIFKDIPVAIYSDIMDKNYRTLLLDKGVLDVFQRPISVEQIIFRVSMLVKLDTLHKKLQKDHQQYGRMEVKAIFYPTQQPLPDKKLFPVFDYSLVKSAVELIKSDYAQYDALDSLVEKLHTNERILTNAFFNIYQCSIAAWVREEKLLVARKLVLNGVGNITQIAHELGYADIAHFSRSFKNRFGCSPKKIYRKDNLFPSAEEHDL